MWHFGVRRLRTGTGITRISSRKTGHLMIKSSASAALLAAFTGIWVGGSCALAEPPAAPSADGEQTVFPSQQIFEDWRFLEANLFQKNHVEAKLQNIKFNIGNGPQAAKQGSAKQGSTVKHLKVDIDGDYFLLQTAGKSGEFLQGFGRNEKNAFEIVRGGEGKPWNVSHFADRAGGGNGGADGGRAAAHANSLGLHYLKGPYDIWWTPVDVFFRSNALRNVKATAIGSGPNKIIAVEFERAGNPHSQLNLDCIVGGVIRFEPARHWAIRDFEIRACRPHPGWTGGVNTRIVQTCTYRSADSIEPAEVQVDWEEFEKGQRTMDRHILTIEKVTPVTLDPKAYTLAAFNVAAPPTNQPASLFTSMWFWMLQAGVLVLLLGVLLRRRAVKR